MVVVVHHGKDTFQANCAIVPVSSAISSVGVSTCMYHISWLPSFRVYFTHSGTKYSHKRILLFTNNDNPHATSTALQVGTPK